MLVDVVLLPPKKISRRLGEISAGLSKKYPLKFIVDNRRLLPHLSLYHLNIDPKKLKALDDKLGLIAKNQRPITLGITAPRSGKFYFVFQTTKPTALTQLHKRVLKEFTPLRTAAMPWPFKLNTQAEKKLFKEYGVPNVLQNFTPHFTLGWANKAGDVTSILADLKKMQKALGSFKISRLAIARVDKDFQVTKIIKEQKLN